MKWRLVLMAGVLAAMAVSTASAAPITQSFSFSATDFRNYHTREPVTAPDPIVRGSFGITYDDTWPLYQRNITPNFVNVEIAGVSYGLDDVSSQVSVNYTYVGNLPYYNIVLGGLDLDANGIGRGSDDFLLRIIINTDGTISPSTFRYTTLATQIVFEAMNIELGEATAVPEPSAASLLAFGLLGIGSFLALRRLSGREEHTISAGVLKHCSPDQA